MSCISGSLKFPVPSLGPITIGFTPPTVDFDAEVCCKLFNFSFALGAVTIPFVMPPEVAAALEVLEQTVDDVNAALEFNIDCPGD